MRIWIDDYRPMPEGFDIWAKTSGEAILALTIARREGLSVEHVAFDHDLGLLLLDFGAKEVEDDSKRVMEWMFEWGFWPDKISVHTANPMAHKWLTQYALDNAPEFCEVDIKDPWNFPGANG